jgi:hypothetical protein
MLGEWFDAGDEGYVRISTWIRELGFLLFTTGLAGADFLEKRGRTFYSSRSALFLYTQSIVFAEQTKCSTISLRLRADNSNR